MGRVKKHKIALFVNTSEKFVRIKKSTQLTLSMNPVEQEYDYIADEVPTTEVEQYKPSIDQDLVMYKEEEDYSMLWPYFYEMKTGSEAHAKAMVVFMNEPVNASTGKEASAETATAYKAWQTDSVISVQDLNAVDGKLNFKLLFGGNIEKGIATVVDGVPTFKA